MGYEATYTDRSGATVSGSRAVVDSWRESEHTAHARQLAMAADLRAQGVRAAHPDDGWVDRDGGTVQLVYPYFNDGPQVGDRIALDHWRDGVRLVEVIEVIEPGPLAAALGLPRSTVLRYRFRPAAASSV